MDGMLVLTFGIDDKAEIRDASGKLLGWIQLCRAKEGRARIGINLPREFKVYRQDLLNREKRGERVKVGGGR